MSKRGTVKETRQSKQCGFCIKINGQVGQGGDDGLVWSGLCQKDSQDDFDSEYLEFDDYHGIYAFIYVRNVRCHACDGRTDSGK